MSDQVALIALLKLFERLPDLFELSVIASRKLIILFTFLSILLCFSRNEALWVRIPMNESDVSPRGKSLRGLLLDLFRLFGERALLIGFG